MIVKALRCRNATLGGWAFFKINGAFIAFTHSGEAEHHPINIDSFGPTPSLVRALVTAGEIWKAIPFSVITSCGERLSFRGLNIFTHLQGCIRHYHLGVVDRSYQSELI